MVKSGIQDDDEVLTIDDLGNREKVNVRSGIAGTNTVDANGDCNIIWEKS